MFKCTKRLLYALKAVCESRVTFRSFSLLTLAECVKRCIMRKELTVGVNINKYSYCYCLDISVFLCIYLNFACGIICNVIIVVDSISS